MIRRLSDFSQEANAFQLLSRCFVYPDDPQRFTEKMALLKNNSAIHSYGYYKKKQLIGIFIFEVCQEGLVIQALACDSLFERQQIASSLLKAVQKAYSFSTFKAETDLESVGFYQKLGFTVHSLGETYPGVIRFLCTLN